jgi:hypothetical protein
VAQFTTVYNIPPNFPLPILSAGTQVNVYDGGFLSGTQLPADSELNIYGGRVPHGVVALEDSVVNVFGGEVNDEGTAGITVAAGAALNILGGRIGIHNRGGVVPATVRALAGSSVVVSGGRIGRQSVTQPSSSFRLRGAEFRLNGISIAGLEAIGDVAPLNLGLNSTLSGVYADGTPFAFSSYRGDGFSNGTLTLERTAIEAGAPPLINVPSDLPPQGVGSGQTLVVDEGGSVPDGFIAGWGATVRMQGGTIGTRFEAVGADVYLNGGMIGNIFVANTGTEVAMSGGDIGQYFAALNGSTVHLFGTSFLLDGVDLTQALQVGTPLLISNRQVPLTGVLADGTPFEFGLSTSAHSKGLFQAGATLLVSRVLPGDYNADGLVDAADFSVWRDSLGSNVSVGTSADGNFDGQVTDADYEDWKSNFGNSLSGDGGAAGAHVPEPTSAVLAAMLLLASALARSCSRRFLMLSLE